MSEAKTRPLIDRSTLYGILFALGQTLLFSVLGMLVKLTSEVHHTVDIIFYRNLISAILVFVFLAGTKTIAKLKQANFKRQLFRGTVGTVAMTLTFAAFAYLPLSEAQSLLFAAPLFVAALSYPLLGEKVGKKRAAAIIVGFAGVLLILQPGNMSSSVGAMIGLAAALGHAAIMLCLRWLGRTEDPVVTIFYFSLIGTIMMLPFLPFFWTTPTPQTLLMLLGIGFLAVGVQFCLTKSYFLAPAAIIAPISYLNLIWSMGLDFMIWQSVPSEMMIAGALIVISSNLFIIYRKQCKKEPVDKCTIGGNS